MKYLIVAISMLFSTLSYSQVKTYTQSQLDSMSRKDVRSKTNLGQKKKDSPNIEIVERIPIYKGCENELSNQKKKECMNQKISMFFEKNYNTTLPEDSKVPSGKTRVFVTFSVDKQGDIVDGVARGADPYLENEALRVLKLLPSLTPGYFRDKPVKIPFSLPLLMVVVNKNDEKNTHYPVYRGCDKQATNAELKKCSIEKIKDFIKLSFDYQMAERVFSTEQSTQFQVDFIINKKGKVEQVNAKANHRAIAIEAIRIAKRLPKFKMAGTKNGKPVDTPFSLLMTVYFP